jgi:hypothetical protein
VRRLLAILLLLVGIVAIAVGVVYLTQAAHSLPSFFPGYAAHAVGKHPKRGDLGIAFGVVLIIVAAAVEYTGSRRSRLH